MIRINGDEVVIPLRGKETVQRMFWFSRLWKPMARYCTVNGTNYWPLISYFVFATNRFFPELPGADRIMSIIDVLKNARADARTLVETDEPDAHAIMQVASKINPSLNVPPLRCRWFQNAIVLRTLLRWRIGARWVIGLARRILGRVRKSEKGCVLFLANTRFLQGKGFPLFDGIRNHLQAQGLATRYLLYTGISDIAGFRASWRKNLVTREAFIGDYYTRGMLRATTKVFDELRRAWRRADESREFRALFTYRGVPFYDALRPHLALAFEAFAYMAADSVSLAKAVLAQERFSVLVLDHEENMYGKGFLLSMQRDRRSCVALSHELIYPGCVHTFARDTSLWKKGVLWRPLPDKKFVGGKHAQRILEEYCNYPPNFIAVTGHPRLDFLFAKRERTATLRSFGLNPQERYILVVSTKKIPDYHLYERIARDNPEYTWVIKPHPKGKEPIIDAFAQHKTPRNLKLVPRTADTYALLDAAEGVLAGRTTVAMEAACLGKLVFILNPQREDLDFFPYVPNREGIVVENPQQLREALRQLAQPRARARRRAALLRYATEQNYGNDGKASLRVAEEILKLARRRRRTRSHAS